MLSCAVIWNKNKLSLFRSRSTRSHVARLPAWLMSVAKFGSTCVFVSNVWQSDFLINIRRDQLSFTLCTLLIIVINHNNVVKAIRTWNSEFATFQRAIYRQIYECLLTWFYEQQISKHSLRSSAILRSSDNNTGNFRRKQKDAPLHRFKVDLTSFLNLLPNWRALSRCSGSAGKKLWNAITSELDEIFSICKLYITQKESSCTMMPILVMNDLDLVFKGQGCAKKQLNYIILLKTSQK